MEEESELDTGTAGTEGERKIRGEEGVWEGTEGAALRLWWVTVDVVIYDERPFEVTSKIW